MLKLYVLYLVVLFATLLSASPEQGFVDSIITPRQGEGEKNMWNVVNPDDPRMIIGTLGHPAEHPKAVHILDELKDGDYAVVVDGDPSIFGVIYFMRPREKNPNWFNYVAIDGEVLGARMLLAPPHRTLGYMFLCQYAEEKGFELVRHNGRDMDGFVQPFFVLMSKSA